MTPRIRSGRACAGGPSRRRAAPRAGLAALTIALLGACSRPGPPLPEVRLWVSPGLPGAVLRDAAARAGIARVAIVGAPADADAVWAADPAEALALGDRLVEGSAPPLPDVDLRWQDPRGRFSPALARARVLIVRPAAGLPFPPSNLRDLADPRLAGRVACVHPGRGAGPVSFAALSLVYGEASTARFLRLLARNRPVVVDSDAEVRAKVASGAAAVGLAGSEDGAAGAASAAGLEVVYPDQLGQGAIVLPTAVAALRPVDRVGASGRTSPPAATEGARRLGAWLSGAAAERVLAARAPGLLPLRAEVPVPVGVEPAGNLVALPLPWDRLAAETARLAPRLRAWPEGFADAPGLAPRPRGP